MTNDTSASCEGWEVVCPDGRVRHYPFHNEGDARGEARHATSRRCHSPKLDLSEIELAQPPCPEGTHVVRAVAEMHRHAGRAHA